MNISDKKENIESVLKNKNIITIEGEIVKLHDEIIEDISREILLNEGKQNVKDNIKIEKFKNYMKDKTTLETAINDKLGKFYFNFYNAIPCKLERQFKFRFIYLCTFLKYGDDRLQHKQENNIYKLYKEKDLHELLKLSKRESDRTKMELINNNLISIDEDKNIHINRSISTVSSISKLNKRDYIRMFKDTIRYLYDNATPRQHKQLGVFIDLLPFIHFKYNIVCKNPSCKLIEDIQPFTPSELSKQLDMYTGKNISSFKRKMLSTHIGDKEAMLYIERFNKKFFAVNPMIYYKGNKIDDINYLIELFNI